MKRALTIILIFLILGFHAKAQQQEYPFTVQKSGSKGKNIILIPGFMSSSSVWNETVTQLNKSNTCHVLQMAGFAGSKPVGQAKMSSWRESISNYIKDQKIEKPIIIGHSLGGVLAMDIAAHHSNLIQSIVVVDALPSLTALMNPTFKASENPDCQQIVDYFTGMSPEQFKAMQTQTANGMSAIPEKQKEIIDWSLQSDRLFSAQMYCDFNNTDLRGTLQHIQVPSLILLNAQFSQIKDTMETQFAGLKKKNIQFANTPMHFLMYDAKDWFMEKISAFIQ